jgi:membrane-associated phospholipid phosphatase
MALTRIDRVIAVYLLFVTVVIVVRGPFHGPFPWLLTTHALVFLLLWLFTRAPADARVGRVLHTLYPLLLLMPLYTEVGMLNVQLGVAHVLAHDAIVQRWEQAIFGTQIAYTWIRTYPSVFWSGLLHLDYMSYYPIIFLGPVLLVAQGRHDAARRVLLTTMVAYLVCFAVFIVFPVAGPNYAFPHPTGPVRNVWSARIVYRLLAGGSSVGAAFPSSHVAATVATVLALRREWPTLAAVFALPCALLVVAVVYCQMHYGVDALSGLGLGIAIAMATGRVRVTTADATSRTARLARAARPA